MIKVKCYKCKKELTETGALLFSIPKKDVVNKYHLCRKCYRLTIQFLNGV
jgi:hypothetical protein